MTLDRHKPYTTLILLAGCLLALLVCGPSAPVAFVRADEGPPGSAPWRPPLDDPLAGTPPQQPPTLPDLAILFISRTPRYPAFKVDYPGGLPVLRAGTEDERRFPDLGELVTLTAHIKNQGLLPAPASGYAWTLDGAPAGSGALPALAPGEQTTIDVAWPWQSDRHVFELRLDTADVVAEACESNNALSHITDALYLAIDVHPFVYAEFARRPNLVGSWSFEDWIQSQVARMNQRLAAAIYPWAPAGVLDRVRVDEITVLDEPDALSVKPGAPLNAPAPGYESPSVPGGDESAVAFLRSRLAGVQAAASDAPLFDGRWGFYVAQDDHHTPEDERRLSAQGYAETYAGIVDWGLVHELTHQLGVVDLYQMNLDAARNTQLRAADGRPLLLGIAWPNPGLMGGGDTAPHDDGTFYSSHTAIGMNTHAGQRRGYYGDYLFDVPAQVTLRILDNRGQPAAGAQIDIFQSAAGAVPPEPVIAGVADADGLLALPNRAFDGAGLTTRTGHTLAANPFGQIDVVGTNALLLVRIRSAGLAPHEEFRWIRLTDLNLAYWAGETDAKVITLETRYPPPAAPPAPTLFGDVEGNRIHLRWLPGDAPGPVHYRIYRGLGPSYVFAFRADAGASAVYEDSLDTTAWYAVTVVDVQGRESAFSNIVRAPRLVGPVAITIDPATMQETVLDAHHGGLFHREPNGDWIGRIGSEHLGLVGAAGMSAGPAGQIAIAQGRRLALLTPARSFISTFLIGSDRVNPDANAAGIVLGGPLPAFDRAPADDARALVLARFDGDLATHGQAPEVAAGLSFVPGRFGEALRVGEGSRLAYVQDLGGPDLLRPVAGSIEFWLRPHWSGLDWQDRVLVDAGDGSSYHLLLVKDAGGGLWVWVEDYDRHGAFAGTGVREWQAEEWHHLAVTWNASRLDLTVDGQLRETSQWQHPITGTMAALWIGSDYAGAYNADADFDELRISALARWDTTDEGRLVATDRGRHQLNVYDLLGNPVSSFGGPGQDLGQFRAPAGLAWLDPQHPQRLLVADQDNGRLQVLDFDGDVLSNPRLAAVDLNRPAGIAVGPDGTWLVSDVGSDRVYQLGRDGAVRRAWNGPNDGHAGGFADPRGLTVRSDGSVLVADSGNSRIVALLGVFPRRSHLPLLIGGVGPAGVSQAGP